MKTLLVAAAGAILALSPFAAAQEHRTVQQMLIGKSAEERGQIKAQAVATKTKTGTFEKHGVRVEIQNIRAIDGGVEVMARAWQGGKAMGFGKDGSVEIERFRVINPPVLVPDINGDVERTYDDGEGNLTVQRFREDPEEAIRDTIASVASSIGKTNKMITKGKVGRTTTIVYPNANVESTSVDGYIANGRDIWSTVHGATSGSSDDSSTTIAVEANRTGVANGWEIYRTIVLFDTSSIPTDDTIQSATLALYATSVSNTTGAGQVTLVQSTPASNTAVAAGDFDQVGATEGATRLALSAVTTSAYNNITLNATGRGWIANDGVTKLGLRTGNDFDNVNIAVTSTERLYASAADTTGTTQDPRLTIEHGVSFVPSVVWFQ